MFKKSTRTKKVRFRKEEKDRERGEGRYCQFLIQNCDFLEKNILKCRAMEEKAT